GQGRPVEREESRLVPGKLAGLVEQAQGAFEDGWIAKEGGRKDRCRAGGAGEAGQKEDGTWVGSNLLPGCGTGPGQRGQRSGAWGEPAQVGGGSAGWGHGNAG